jgi:hypothetical protein
VPFRARGTIRIPWFNHGRSFVLPRLSLGDTLDLMRYEVAILRELGMTDQTPQWERERFLDVVDVEFAAESLARRLQQVDPTFTRAAFDRHVQGRAGLLEVVALVAEADAAQDFGSAPARGPASSDPASGTIGGWLRKKWRTWSAPSRAWRARAATASATFSGSPSTGSTEPRRTSPSPSAWSPGSGDP